MLREETDALNQQRDAAIADAEAAVAKAAALGMKTSDVEVAVLTVHEATHDTVAEGNVLADCGAVVDEAAFMACTNNAVESFNVALTAEINAVADLRTEITQLEEAMQ